MKHKIIFSTLMIIVAMSCNKLDVQPERQGTLEEAFSTVNNARNFLYSCYSFMPDSYDFNGEPQNCGASDEVALTSQWATTWHYSKAINIGSQTAANPIYNYWSYLLSPTQASRSKAYNLYGGIRQCYIFLNRIKTVPGIENAEVESLSSQAKFLIAYYHFLLLRLYGPIVIMEDEIPLESTDEKLVFPKRRPYDSCVNWIVKKLDEVTPSLPQKYTSDLYGAPTKVIAKGMKARMLLYAASPLFNGNAEFYADFQNKDGEKLISLQYDKEKWKKALDAAEDAINEAHTAGHSLFVFLQTPANSTTSQKGYFNRRWNSISMPRDGNNDIIWGLTKAASNYQNMVAVRGISKGSTNIPYGGIAPSLQMIETYLTKNGLPIDKDPEYNYAARYSVAVDPGSKEKTALLHLNREPRFYADVAYDRASNYELNGKDGVKGGRGYTLYMRMGEVNPETGLTNGNDPLRDGFTPNGYYFKKYLHPNTSFENNKASLRNVAYPLLRLTELYLNYAEAYYEYFGTLNGKALQYINDIRASAGIPDVETAWTGVEGKDYREIIRRERTIELMFEGHRFFDARRWKTAHLTFSKMQKGWNTYPSGFSKTKVQPAESYLTLQNTAEPAKSFTVPQHYLFPIDSRDVDINPNLVNNPGW